ncbi:MAG TPA: MATE family efflux transporter [Haploplasma sp.]|nr:MATE family efflux transporter [Haploplasma sp.]
MGNSVDVKLNKKDRERRDSILNKSLWKVLFAILVPIAMYNFLTFLFGVFDLKIVSMFPNDPKDSVAFFDEIKNAISAFGGGFAAGGAVIVANLYGEGKIDEARKNAGVVLILTTIISVGLILLTVVGVIPLLKLIGFDANIINEGSGYFYIQVATTALTAINVVFIGLEKSKGNTRSIFLLNIAVAVIKVGLTLFVVFVLKLQTLEWVAATTLIAQLVLTIIAIFSMFSKKNIFRINLKDLSFNKRYIKQMFIISIPVIFGKFIMSFGKIIVNLFATMFYGAEVLSALTITYKANLGFGALANSVEEAEMSIISQNVGNKSPKRGFKTVKIGVIYTLIITIVGVIVITLLADPAVKFFISKPTTSDPALWDIYYQKVAMAKTILSYERFSMLTTALIGTFLGGFYGFRMTKISYGINFVRLFIFRIPVLFILYYGFSGITGPNAIGLTMLISNTATALLVGGLFISYYFRHKNTQFQEFLTVDSNGLLIEE